MKAKAESIYAKITSYANYSQINGIEREWFVKCIEEGLVEVNNEFKNLALPHVSGSVLNINLHEYGYSCGDGCCYNYGTITTVNKTELPCHNQDAGTILRQVLEHLGYCVEITYSDDVS